MPPLLYHRESCQVYKVPMPKGTPQHKPHEMAVRQIDPAQIRAWAKGRQVRVVKPGTYKQQQSGSASSGPRMISKDEDAAMDQEELLNELEMTPLQRKGKQAIKERAATK